MGVTPPPPIRALLADIVIKVIKPFSSFQSDFILKCCFPYLHVDIKAERLNQGDLEMGLSCHANFYAV